MSAPSRFLRDCDSLRLKVLNDAANGVAVGLEKLRHRNAFQLGIGERYIAMKGDFLELDVAIRADGNDYIITISIEPAEMGEFAGWPEGLLDLNVYVGHVARSGQGEAMLVRPRHPSEQPQEIVAATPSISARVRFVSLQGRMKGGRNVLALVASDGSVEIVGASGEREVCVPLCLARNKGSRGICCLVESVPQIFNDIAGLPTDVAWDRIKSYFEFIHSCLVIELFDHSCRARIKESFNERFKLVELRICPPH